MNRQFFNEQNSYPCCIQIEVETEENKGVNFQITATNYLVDWGDNTTFEQTFTNHEYKTKQKTSIRITGINFTTFQIVNSECIITELNIEAVTLVTLDCSNINLKKLDLTKCYNLITLFCHNNKLSQLLLASQKELLYLDCRNNKLQDLNLSDCPSIKIAICNNNNLQTISLKNCIDIVYIDLFNNQFSHTKLNSIFWELPPCESAINQINIGINPGTEKCDLEILEQKKWLLDVSCF